MAVPSEKYLLWQRGFTFADEWLFYLLLLYLFEQQHYRMMSVVAVIGTIIIVYSYKRQWDMETQRWSSED